MKLSFEDFPPKPLRDWIEVYEEQFNSRKIAAESEVRIIIKLIGDLRAAVLDRTHAINFLKDILNSGTTFASDGINVNFGFKSNNSYSFNAIRNQAYLALFCAIGGTYDVAARTCEYALNTMEDKWRKIRPDSNIQNVMSLKNKLVGSHIDILTTLYKTYGYFLGTMVYLRNYHVHRGNCDEKQFFVSNECTGLDNINPDMITKIEQDANSYYEILKYETHGQDLKTFAGKSFIDLVENYLLYTDNMIGLFLNCVVSKHLSILPNR